MKPAKYLLLPFVISLILFIIPFFWLKPGEMDMGGDSNRLYFYDPLSYLRHHTPYNIVPTGIGGEAISYYALPYIFILLLLRFVFSPTFVICLVNGLKLAGGFIFCYLLIKELLSAKLPYKNNGVETSSILSAIFYTISPILVHSGWEKAIFSHMQVFLNPLFFFLLLRFFISGSKKYLFGALLLSFIFSMAFSYAASPPFFAFYPLSVLYIFLYTKFIRQKTIPWRGLIIGIVLFFFLQSFHLIPHMVGVFSFGSDVSASVFSDQAKFSRGLDYFTAIAPSIKVSIGLFGLPQRIDMNLVSYLYIVFPLIILLGFYYNKSKTLLLTGLFFLIVLFFACANITDSGFFLYKSLFYIPGFKMFRNFFAQWSFTYIFFYSVLLSQALVIVLDKIKYTKKILLSCTIVLLILSGSWELLTGRIVSSFHHQSDKIKSVFEMDPEYEKVLNFVYNNPIDGKILTFPLAGPGYQVISGKDGRGAYVGPSTFSYLAGKNDYTGYEGLAPFSDIFVNAARNKDYGLYQRLFPILNIKYVFHNSDTRIYDSNFPSYPYDYPREFMPQTQSGYGEFIEELPLDFENKISLGEKFHFYPVKQETFLPHIYTSNNVIYTTNPLEFQFNPEFNIYPARAVFLDLHNSRNIEDKIILEAETDSLIAGISNNFHLHQHKPFISLSLDSIYYPFALLREDLSRLKRKNAHDEYLNFSHLFLSKRIGELDEFGEKLPLGSPDWKKPRMWELYNTGTYKNWHASIARYKSGMEDLISWIGNQDSSETRINIDKIKVSEQLHQHRTKLIKIIWMGHKSQKDKEYLFSLVNETFDSLFTTLALPYYDSSFYTYTVLKPYNILPGQYEIYIENRDNVIKDIDKTYIQIENKILRPITVEEGNVIRFENVTLSNNDLTKILLYSPTSSITTNLNWRNSADIGNVGDTVSFKINNYSLDSSGGVITDIPGWLPNKQYIVTFDYQTLGDNFLFRLYDNQEGGEEGRISGQTYFEKNLSSREWEKSQSILTSNSMSQKAFLQFVANSAKTDSTIQIKNLSIVEIKYPSIILKKIPLVEEQKTLLPKITFRKINLTKYEITVEGAQDPYLLVFSEAFSKHWNLFYPGENNTTLVGRIEKIAGWVGWLVAGIFGKDEKNTEIAQSYFDGNIREGKHVDAFFEPATFDSWGKKTVAYHSHFRANGYANAWHITPQDTDGKTSYTLVLEMGNQRYFYVFLVISIVTALLLLYLFIVSLKRNAKNN